MSAFGGKADITMECALAGGQFQAAALTGCWACGNPMSAFDPLRTSKGTSSQLVSLSHIEVTQRVRESGKIGRHTQFWLHAAECSVAVRNLSGRRRAPQRPAVASKTP
jgi:hypothetical protein